MDRLYSLALLERWFLRRSKKVFVKSFCKSELFINFAFGSGLKAIVAKDNTIIYIPKTRLKCTY